MRGHTNHFGHDVIWCLGRLRVIIAVVGGLDAGLLVAPQAQDGLVAFGQSDDASEWWWFAAGIVWLALNAWFWSDFALATRAPPREDATPIPWPRRRRLLILRLWLPRLLGMLPFMGVSVALLGASAQIPAGMRSMMGPDSGTHSLALAAGLITLLGLAFAALLCAARPARAFLGRPLKASMKVGGIGLLGGLPGAILIAASLAAAAAGLAFFGCYPVQAGNRLQSAPTILFATAALISGGTILTWFGADRRIPLIGSLLAFAFVLAELRDADIIPDNHDIRTLALPLPPRPQLSAAFQQFAAANAAAYPAPERLPVILVATSGGGLAAAFWTGTILGDLADTVPRFANQLFAISGVSGGGLGALETVAMIGHPPDHADCRGVRGCTQRTLGADFLAPTLGAMLYPDLVQRFLPVPVFQDRAAALEQAWEARWHSVTGNTLLAGDFLKLWPQDHPWPALLLNGTSVRSGGRVITSNLQLAGGDMELSMDAADLLRTLGAPVRASTAADNSARFPLFGPVGVARGQILPNGALPRASDLVVDGGYFEDFGATTLLETLDVLQEAAARANIPVRFIVLQIIGAPPVPMPGMASPSMPRGFFGPLVTLLRTRDARGAAASEALARRTAELGGVYVPLRLGFSPTGQAAPLSWSLSPIAQHVIDVQWTKECRDRLADDMKLTRHGETGAGMNYAQMMAIKPCVPTQ